MSLHKLTAGDGYTYLTRQVAAQDATHRESPGGLGEYYAERGESPGVWVGHGADGLPGFPTDPHVTEAQMAALFGHGRHPDAARIRAGLVAAGADPAAVLAATRLGRPYQVHSGVGEWRTRLAACYAQWNELAGLPPGQPVPEDERARIRTALARELFTAQLGRAPVDARELAGFVARASRQRTTAVAGYDLTFTPVKSVSALWALAPMAEAQAIEDCHDAAVTDTVRWLERSVACTRLGRNGVRQVDVVGLVGAAFTHRDSRAGDPNLHTHVAVSNKVQVAVHGAAGQAGQWGALDGRPLHKLAVAASERYNTRLEALLSERLGLRFADRPREGDRRPVREVVGVEESLTRTWSARRAVIDLRRIELSTAFQAEHGRPPSPVEALKLAQRATLETRAAKHEPRSLADQRSVWRDEALAVLGGAQALGRMLAAVHQRPRMAVRGRTPVTPEWVTGTAATVVATVSASRATWQEAHVRAEAERQVRTAELPSDQVDAAVERVVAAALSPAHSLTLGVTEPVSEPAVLRRADGTSTYAHAGLQRYTCAQVVAAEQALLAAARRDDGRRVDPAVVAFALTGSTSAGVSLNPGQAAMVTELATSGRRLQLALAPAGTGKTTAMAVLARAWGADGGTVVGLAPSAAAAAVLGADLGAPTDTLAKLLWSLDTLQAARTFHGRRTGGTVGRGPVPGWVRGIGSRTLVVIDEAGMAGTADLARAVAFVLDRGGSVRLVGDDRQLAAVAAGGVLRDLAGGAGAVTLSQVVRFTDPAEGAASLGLRAGDPAAVAFYTDSGRVHVGDAGTATGQAFTAWAADRAAGLDALMLAPTREDVLALNTRARHHRLTVTGGPAGRQLRLADASTAGAGDTVVTRRNDRRLTTGPVGWVRNGDRWTVDTVAADGSLHVTSLAGRRRLTLPPAYAAAHVELGYASTVHAAQGSTCDVSHAVATGNESRQLLYVAMTRGRRANHLYLAAAGDGNEHDLLTPDVLAPPTAVDLLTRILARDGAQTSATTTQQRLADPTGRLAAAADRYQDSLTVAAEHHLGPQRLTALDAAAEQALPDLTQAAAWPTLRGHLALLAAGGHDPAATLATAVAQRALGDALDVAAVLDWRLDPSGGSRRPGPLPWLPPVPVELAADPLWGGYLQGRDAHVRALAEQVASQAHGWTPSNAPGWAAAPLRAAAGAADPAGERSLLGQLAVWRAAHGVDDTELRPTGPSQPYAAAASTQRELDAAVRRHLGRPAGGAERWRALASQIEPRLVCDPYWPQLADRLVAADRAGVDIAALARSAGRAGPLPDEQPAAALWWRLSRHLTPATASAAGGGATGTLRPVWTPVLHRLVGPQAARTVLADPAWPALVAGVTDAAAAGWTPEQVLGTAHGLLRAHRGDQDHGGCDGGTALPPGELATALIWQVAMLNDPDPHHGNPADGEATLAPPDPYEQDREPPHDLYDGAATPRPVTEAEPLVEDAACWQEPDEEPDDEPTSEPDAEPDEPPFVTSAYGGGLPWLEDDPGDVSFPSPPGTSRNPSRSQAAGQASLWPSRIPPAVPAGRLLELNRQAGAYFTARYTGSWAARHLRERLGTDLAGDDRFTPGHAPPGWTGLTDHLRALGASETELLAAGLAGTARSGGLVDRFRDRLVLPIRDLDGNTVGFVGRRNPATPDAGPKYLNTADTAVFSKGAQLYGLAETTAELAAGARPVLVEGPLDAIAVTLAGAGTAVGVAPLGTALTDSQADQLRPYLAAGAAGVVVATDADSAGRRAAERAYWQLTCRGGNPLHLTMPDGHDPASVLAARGPQALQDALTDPPTLARTLIETKVGLFTGRLHEADSAVFAVRAAADVIGALPPRHWPEHIAHLDTLVHTAPGQSHLAVIDAGQAWTEDPDGESRRQLVARPVHLGSTSISTTASPGAVGDHHADVTETSSVAEQWAAGRWVDVGRSIEPRLVTGADWAGLAAALERASRSGYDVQQHLPRLAAQDPLPTDRPARALHYRLVHDCPAAVTPLPAAVRSAEDRARADAVGPLWAETQRRHDHQLVRPANHANPRPQTAARDDERAVRPARPTRPTNEPVGPASGSNPHREGTGARDGRPAARPRP